MTIDKIQFHMTPEVFKFWTEDLKKEEPETQKTVLKNAYTQLKTEIRAGILNDIKYHAELLLILQLGGDIFSENN